MKRPRMTAVSLVWLPTAGMVTAIGAGFVLCISAFTAWHRVREDVSAQQELYLRYQRLTAQQPGVEAALQA